MKSNLLEVTIETPKDQNVFFRPFGGCLRGRKDFQRIAAHQIDAMTLHQQFPRGVPGTLLQIDLDAKAVTLVETLRQPEWAPERESLESRDIEIPRDVVIDRPHLPDWLHATRRAVDAGFAKVVKGELPKDLGEESKRPAATDVEEQRIDKLCGLIETLIERLVPAGK
ncbi:MAG TPA: hypothetical protein VMV10_08715 [Pirellulales bacterium]|nr:hypothetical protein [Pirellulales bacterium]